MARKSVHLKGWTSCSCVTAELSVGEQAARRSCRTQDFGGVARKNHESNKEWNSVVNSCSAGTSLCVHRLILPFL